MNHDEIHTLLHILHLARDQWPGITAAVRGRLGAINAELAPAPAARTEPAWVDEATAPKAVRAVVSGLPGPAEPAPAPSSIPRI